MDTQTLEWSEPRQTGYASTRAEDAAGTWRITPVPRDVARIRFDPNGGWAIDDVAYAESADEAKMAVAIIRAGTDGLQPWQAQLEAAGFRRTYPNALPADILSDIWHMDIGTRGHFQITVSDREDRLCVHATFERNQDSFWHNVCRISGFVLGQDGSRHDLPLPESVDVLKAGVAASLAILRARLARPKTSFRIPLGGETK